MDVNSVIERIKTHPEAGRIGMILTHLGVVRSFNLDGREIETLELSVDYDQAEAVRAEMLAREGIVEVVLEFSGGVLQVGDPIMIVAVAGETRTQIIPVLEETINRIKAGVTSKRFNV